MDPTQPNSASRAPFSHGSADQIRGASRKESPQDLRCNPQRGGLRRATEGVEKKESATLAWSDHHGLSAPSLALAVNQAMPGSSDSVSQKLILAECILELLVSYQVLLAKDLKTQPRDSQGATALNTREIFLQPSEARGYLRPILLLAQSDQRPRRGNDERLSVHSVGARVSAIPSPAGTHPVEQHGSGQLPAPCRASWKQFPGALTQRDKRERSWLYPAAGPWCPSPSTIRVIVLRKLAHRRELLQHPAKRAAVFGPVFAEPAQSGRNSIGRLLVRHEGPTSKRAHPATSLLLWSGRP